MGFARLVCVWVFVCVLVVFVVFLGCFVVLIWIDLLGVVFAEVFVVLLWELRLRMRLHVYLRLDFVITLDLIGCCLVFCWF